MTNFDVLRDEITKCTTPDEMFEVLNEFRFEIFPCEMDDKCIQGYSCQQCYREWLMKEI